MDSTVTYTPGSVQRSDPSREDRSVSAARPVPPSQLADHAIHSDIAELAYLLWEERGYPSRSAESDWLEAERRIEEGIKHRPIEPE